jgi:transposase, IS30 family
VKRLSDEVVAVGLVAFFRGESVSGAARLAGISRTTLFKRLDELGVAHPKKVGQGRVPDSVVASALTVYRGGVSLAEAALGAGISQRTLLRRLDSNADRVVERKHRPGSLSLADREEIRVGIALGQSDAEIGARINRHRSTVWREIKANGDRKSYRVVQADERSCQATKRPKSGWTVIKPELWVEVQRLLREKKWSPEQIAKRLRRDHNDKPQWCVSAESIYEAIYVQTRGELRRELIGCLRQSRPRRQPQRRATSQAPIKDMVNIAQRPPEQSNRAFPGSWEGDLIVGIENKSMIATLVERTTRFGFLIKLENKTAPHVAEQISRVLAELPEFMRKSLTWDQGTELAAHSTVTGATNMAVYFCDPHSPWQRPTNENFNGLARQFLPKYTDLSIHTQQQLNEIANLLNERPCRVLAWDTTKERYEQLVATTT